MSKINNKISNKTTWIVIALLFFLTVISNADKAVIGFASISIIQELELTPEQWGLVGSSFFFLYSLSAILVGILADKIGIKKVIAGMATVWAIIQFSTIFISNYGYLLVTRIILGAGEGPSYSLAMTAASKYLPKEKLGIGLTLVSVGGPLGVAISAPFLIHLISNYGWRTAFIATGIVGVIWIIPWLIIVKEEKVSKRDLSITNIDSIDAQISLETKFASVLFSKNFLLIAFCGFATYWSFTIGLNWLPNYLENIRNISSKQLSIFVSLPWIMITFSQIFFSSLSDYLYNKTQNFVKSRVYILGPVMVAGGASYFLGTLVSSNYLVISLLSLGLTFGCITLVLGPALLVDLVTKEHQGKIQGWFMAFTSLGGIVGPYFTGLLIQKSSSPITGFHSSFHVCAIILLVSGGLVWFGVRPKKIICKD
ncbi:MFS transporter [Lysinibacillus sp. FSL P2-0066]|uniref:MFS transporter n=1 Tax=Lysinibacillus sp. FSL P2-0066 TaxID=2921720 RepID=UPI0030D729FD